MNKEQFQQWLKGMSDGIFWGLGYAAENTTTVAIGAVVSLLVVALLFGLIAKAVRKKRLKKARD